MTEKLLRGNVSVNISIHYEKHILNTKFSVWEECLLFHCQVKVQYLSWDREERQSQQKEANVDFTFLSLFSKY